MLSLLDILTKKNSGTIAKKRLQFVLITDRAGCTAELLDMLKDDMIKAISKYMEIDGDRMDIKVTHAEGVRTGECGSTLNIRMPVRIMLTKGIC